MIEPAITVARRLVEMRASVVIGSCRFVFDIIEPDAVIWDPATAFGTEPAGATVIPIGLTMEPFDCTTEPAGTFLSIFGSVICPSVVVGVRPTVEIIVPDAVTSEPARSAL
jgi:hypothetical protein